MPRGIDRPSGPPADGPGRGGAPDGSQDELRRRLANLPANHPSSPWYQERRRERAARRDQPENVREDNTESHSARVRPDRSAEPGESRPARVDRNRAAESGVSASGRPAQARRAAEPRTADGDAAAGGRGPEAGREMSGEAAVIAARAARGVPGRPEKESRRREDGGRGDAGRGSGAWSNEALGRLAASQHAASEARRRERGKGTPITPAGRREPYRPWFADGADDELWLSAEETGEPWFTQD
jgi:hypothetical protein